MEMSVQATLIPASQQILLTETGHFERMDYDWSYPFLYSYEENIHENSPGQPYSVEVTGKSSFPGYLQIWKPAHCIVHMDSSPV